MDQQALQNQAQVLALQQAQRETQLAVLEGQPLLDQEVPVVLLAAVGNVDRKSTRLNSSRVKISYAVFCLKKKTEGAQIVQRRLGHTGSAHGGRVGEFRNSW